MRIEWAFEGTCEELYEVFKSKEIIEAILEFLRHRPKPPKPPKPDKKKATHIVVKEDGHEMEEGEMGKPLSNTDVRRLTLVPKDDKEKVDSIQSGTMKAVSTDDAICAVALDPQDELQAKLTPVDGAMGLVTFTFTADADLGEGVTEIHGEYSCDVVDQMATIIQVEEGEDLPKAPTVTPVSSGGSKSKP
jgi:hypothetical protein